MEVREPSAKYLVRPGYKQTEVGLIPADWSVETLLTLAGRSKERFDDGDWIEAEYLTESGIRLVQTGNIGVGTFIDKAAKKYISADSFELLRCKDIKEGDLLVCRLAEPAGRACLLPRLEEEKAITAVDVTIFRPVDELADRRYLMQWFGTQYWFAAVNERCGGSTRTRIARGALGKIPIPVPKKAEQEAIAEALSDADALIEFLEQLLAKKRHVKQGAMQALLTGKKRLPGFSEAWRVRRLPELAGIRSGGTPSTSQPRFWNGEIPWCTPTDITALNGLKYLRDTSRKISLEGLKASSAEFIPADSIVMTSRATIGECAINLVPVTTNQGFKNFVPFNDVDVEFLFYVLLMQKQRFISLCGGSTFLEIGKTQLAAFEIHVPTTKAEQTAIATILSDMDAELAALEAKLTKARQIKQAMMQALLTGRIRLV